MPLLWNPNKLVFVAPKAVDEVTPNEFFDLCERFDWFYEWSDDSRIWKIWAKRHEFLMSVLLYHRRRKTDKPYQAIYEAFQAYHYSGEAWKTEKAPVPKRDLFINIDRQEAT